MPARDIPGLQGKFLQAVFTAVSKVQLATRLR